MARKKEKEEMIENAKKLAEINDAEIEPIEVITNTVPEVNEIETEENNERVDIDNIVSEKELEKESKVNLKIKEIKYGFSVLTNIGNYENIRTQIEVSTEIGEDDKVEDVLDALSKQVKDWGRKEYKDIKRRTKM